MFPMTLPMMLPRIPPPAWPGIWPAGAAPAPAGAAERAGGELSEEAAETLIRRGFEHAAHQHAGDDRHHRHEDARIDPRRLRHLLRDRRGRLPRTEELAEHIVAGAHGLLIEMRVRIVESRGMLPSQHRADDLGQRTHVLGLILQSDGEGRKQRVDRRLGLLWRQSELLGEIGNRLAPLGRLHDFGKIEHDALLDLAPAGRRPIELSRARPMPQRQDIAHGGFNRAEFAFRI
jgi:hypothetical protein